jgi:hypothetical protein
VLARGRYVTTVTVLVLAGEDLLRERVSKAFSELRLHPPDSVARVRESPLPSARSLLERAQAAAELAELEEAWRLYAEARALAGGDSRATEAWLRDRAAWRIPGHVEEALAVLASDPGNRRVRAAVAEVVAGSGDVEGARGLLVEGLAAAPGDRTLGRALERLQGP